jgi:hypothetical protein
MHCESSTLSAARRSPHAHERCSGLQLCNCQQFTAGIHSACPVPPHVVSCDRCAINTRSLEIPAWMGGRSAQATQPSSHRPKIRVALRPTLETLHIGPCARYVASILDHISRRHFRSMGRRAHPLSQLACFIGQLWLVWIWCDSERRSTPQSRRRKWRCRTCCWDNFRMMVVMTPRWWHGKRGREGLRA